MLQKLNRTDDASRARQQGRQRPARGERPDKELQARIGDLRNLPHDKLADAVFLLSMAAKQQSEQIRRSILERAEIEIEPHASPKGDLAEFLAGEAVSFLRHHELGGPSLMDILSSRSPDVDFTIEQHDAVAMVAAVIREQRLDGILEGLRLAGLLSRPSKNRHDDLSA
jgi:hypothetical protein